MSWTVENKSKKGETREAWSDLVYLSDQPVRNAPGAHEWLLGDFPNVKALRPGETYANIQTFTLSPAARGLYVIVQSTLGDADLTNNQLSAATTVTGSVPDVQVSVVTPAAVAYSGERTTIRYTVTNVSGLALWSGTQYWTDAIWFSKDPTFIQSRATFLGTAQHSNLTTLPAGGQYTASFEAVLPKGIEGQYYVYVFANAHNPENPLDYAWPYDRGSNRGAIDFFTRHAYEDPTNNLGRGTLPVIYHEPDLQVTTIQLPATIVSGQTIAVTYTVTNVGTRETREQSWWDRLYLSRDPSLDNSDYLLRDERDPLKMLDAEVRHSGRLKLGEAYNVTFTVTIPYGIEGPFHFIGATDLEVRRSGYYASSVAPGLPGVSGSGTGDVQEFQGEGNNTTARAATIVAATPPDLQVTDLTVPERATRGRPFSCSYRVSNVSAGATAPLQGAWSDQIYLSRDQLLDTRADRYIGGFSHEGGMAANSFYDQNPTLTAPADMLGVWYVFVVTDPARGSSDRAAVFEGENERNNTRMAGPILIENPPPSDLQVTDIVLPGPRRSGEPIHVEWTVENLAATEAAAGSWSDSVYLSSDAAWDIGDKPLGRGTFSGTVAAGGTYTLTLDILLPATVPGDYHLIVRTDIFNQVFEDVQDANNTTSSGGTFNVTVDELVLGAPVTLHLKPGQEKLYQITVPNDRTLRFTVDGQNANAANEIFVRYHAAPSSAAYDAGYEGPVAADVTAIVAGTQPGRYYVLVRGFSGPAAGGDVTVLAELLPLVITDVDTDTGGDSKHVTVRIEGAQFSDRAIIKLVRPGIAEFEPVTWDVVDSSLIIAAFDFTGAPHGLYDLKVINPSGDTAVVPYRFLVERAIEPEVTIGIGGARVIPAGDQATYSIALQNISNLDAPYTFFQVGVPELLLNQYVYGLPFLQFFTNVRGTPEGAAGTANADVPWASIESITNTTGQLDTSGYIFDLVADGFGGFSFNIVTYPGLRAMADRAFDDFRAQVSGNFPDLDYILEDGPDALGTWWDAVKEKVSEISPGLGAALDQLDFVGMYQENVAVPGECEIPFIPFRFHIYAAATTMTRAEFVAHQRQEALDLRDDILADTTAAASLVALVADADTWVDLYLAALEEAGILRPDGALPPIRTQQHIVSLMAVLSSGILFGPAGSEVRSTSDLVAFFDQVRAWYGHEEGTMAAVGYEERSCRHRQGEIPVPALPPFEDYDLGLSMPTHFEAFHIYVPWLGFDRRGAGLPADFQINGPVPVDGSEFQSLNFDELFEAQGGLDRLASITGPQTWDTAGWLPVLQDLPYAINFQNPSESSRYLNDIQVVTKLDADLDGRTFKLGDLKIGDITVHIPQGRSTFQGDFDFSQVRGFILRVSAGVDLYSNTATWVLQAIDPLTGEVLQDPTRGLLAPNDGQGHGEMFVGYTIQAKDDLVSGTEITAQARVLSDGLAPEDTITLTQVVDGAAPTSHVTATRLAAESNSFRVDWSVVDDSGSGVKHVTLYVATDGGDFKIWQRQVTEAAGSAVFEGEAGHTYEFLALATDIAGNREKPRFGVNATDDGSGVNLGALPTVTGTTPPNFGQAPEPVPEPSTNPLFTQWQNVPSQKPLTRPSEFDIVFRPFVAQAFATGIGQSHGHIGPMALVELADGSVLVSGGSNRGVIYKFGKDGGTAGTPWAQLDHPVFNLALDADGRLWATTGGGPLLQLDADSGAVVNSFGDGITMGLAVDPVTGVLYVGSNAGVQKFDPATGTFEQFSRDLNLRVGSLAFDQTGTLWAVTWPDRRQVVRFTARARVEVMLSFDTDIDSIAFGQNGSALDELLFVSHNSGAVSSTGAVSTASELTMVDLATLQRVAIARNGTRGDVVLTTRDGRILLSQSTQVDVIQPAVLPGVTAVNPPNQAVLPLPLPFVAVTFNQDMLVGDAALPGSVLNPGYYRLTGAVAGDMVVRSVVYDVPTRTAYLTFDGLLPDTYALTVRAGVASVLGPTAADDYQTTFTAVDDLTPYVDIHFDTARSDRNAGTISYDVTLRNKTDANLVLPVLLLLDPAAGYAGVPTSAGGQTADGKWLIDLSTNLPGSLLAPGATTTGRTVTIDNPGQQRIQFTPGVAAGAGENQAPVFSTEAPTAAAVGQLYQYDAHATDPDANAIVFHLFSGPEGMTVDMVTGLVQWTPTALDPARTLVVLQVFDSRGAVTLQRFVLNVTGGNHAPTLSGVAANLESPEGTKIEFRVLGADLDDDGLYFWADRLPAGAAFDPATQTFTWTPGYNAAGTYNDIRFVVSDGIVQTTTTLNLVVTEGRPPLVLLDPADATLREGDRLRFYLHATSADPANLAFSSPLLPYRATLHPTMGLFDWQPTFTQARVYEIPFTATDGVETVTVTVKFTVTNANAAPQFLPQQGWQVYEGQVLSLLGFALDPDNPNYMPPQRDAEGDLVTDGYPATVTFSVQDLPAGATFDADTTELRWQPTYNQAGTYYVTFIATDDGDGTGIPLTSTMIVPIEVVNLNQRPVFETLGDVTVPANSVRLVTIRATDPEGGAISFSATSESTGFPLPSFMTLTDNHDGTATLRIAPVNGQRGDYGVVISATDTGDGDSPALTTDTTFVVTVDSPNEAPQWRFVGDVVAVAGQSFTMTVRADDPDQEPLTFALAGLPAGATLTPGATYGTALLAWTPAAGDLGGYDVTFTVTDGGNGGAAAALSDTTTMRLVVKETNAAPVLGPVGNRSVAETQTLTLNLTATDADGDTLHFVMANLPRGASFDPATGVFTWTPALDQAGSYDASFTVSDGLAGSSETIRLAVTNTNQAPMWVQAIEQFAREGVQLDFTVVAGDRDGDQLVYSVVSGLPQGAVFVPRTGLFLWTPGYEQAGEYVVRFVVVDAGGLKDEMDVTLRVANVNRAPVLATGSHTVLLGRPSSFTLQGGDPDAGTVLTFRGLDLPAGASVDPNTGVFSWTPGPGQAGEYLVTFEASDGEATTQKVIVLRATATPAPPDVLIELTPSFPALPGQRVLVHAIAGSLGDIVTLTLTADGQLVELDADGRAYFTPTQPGKVDLVATATDVDGLVGTRHVQLKVRDPQDRLAPVVGFAETVARAMLTTPMALTGTVADTNLDYWRLEIAGSAAGPFTELARGETSVDGVLLAEFDPSQRANGFYTLRLTAADISGRVSQTTTLVEVNTAAKPAAHTRIETDLNVDLAGVTLSLRRLYNSLDQSLSGLLGAGWAMLNREVRLATDLPATGREGLGIYAAFRDGTRVYLTLPSGERAGFEFRPVAVIVGGRMLYRAAWTGTGAAGYTLQSADALLTRAGARYYEFGTGQAYNPASSVYADADYILTGPDGTRYLIDSTRGIFEEQRSGGKRLYYSDSGVVSNGGASVQFLRDAAGRLTSVTAPGGVTITYQYDVQGRLVAVRNLGAGTGSRYGYAAAAAGPALLTSAVATGGAGDAIVYPGDASAPQVRPIRADLGGVSQFTGQARAGTLTAGGLDLYTFSLRGTEIASTNAERVIMRVAVRAGADLSFVPTAPAIAGLTPLSVQITGGSVVALFALEQEGLYQLAVGAGIGGAYTLAVGVAGDVNASGRVDGVDSTLLAGGDSLYDIDGDAVVNDTDVQILIANYGFVRNGGPELLAQSQPLLTHVDLRTTLALNTLASDPDGDAVFFRIIGATHGTAALSADGMSLVFMPDAGYTGPATVQVVADDGFNSSPTGQVQINVSSAPLLSLDFQRRRLLLEAGATGTIVVLGQFADQADVVLPLDYVTAQILDPTIATISASGVVTAKQNGTTTLVVRRGNLQAATAIGVGLPGDSRGLVLHVFGIDAYPNAVTLAPGGQRQIVVSLGSTQEMFIQAAAAGTRYYVGDSSVVSVTADGLIQAAGEGTTTITVICGDAEETITVQVEPAAVGPVVVDAAGAIVQGPQGYQVSIGPGQLTEDATVSVVPIAESNLTVPVPPAFNYAGAFSLEVDGANLNGPVQIAAPVDPSIAAPGDQVWFLRQVQLPDENGVLHEYWASIDIGVVDAGGVARTTSPPFPGLSQRGNVLIARAAQPLGTIRLNAEFYKGLMWASIGALGVVAMFGASGGLLGASVGLGIAGAMLAMALLPMAYQAADIAVWRAYGRNAVGAVMTVNPPPGIGSTIVSLTAIVPEAPAPGVAPAITAAGAVVMPDGTVRTTIRGSDFFLPGDGQTLADTRVVFTMNDRRVIVPGTAYASAAGTQADSTIVLQVPATILLGMAKISVERPITSYGAGGGAATTDWMASQQVQVKNENGFAFIGKVVTTANDGPGVEVIDINRAKVPQGGTPGAGETEQVVARIPLPGAIPFDTVATTDLSAVYVATNKGIAVIDATTLQQFDVDATTPALDYIWVPDSNGVNALAIDPDANYLYAAGTDAVWVVDLHPGSANFHKVDLTASLTPLGTPNGYISDLAVDADGRKLYIAAPATRMFGGTNAWTRGGRDHGRIFVYNVDEADRPEAGAANTRKWRKQIGVLDGGLEPFRITATTEAKELAFTARMDINRGFHTIKVTNDDPLSYAATVGGVSLDLVDAMATYQLDIRTASGVVVTPDRQWAFVGDWYLSLVVGSSSSMWAVEYEETHEVGSKIGIIHKPFESSAELYTVTTPIPMAFLEDLALSSDGQKLYANYRNAGNLVVFDVAKFQQAAQAMKSGSGQSERFRRPVDHPQVEAITGININLEPINIAELDRGLSVQPNDPLTLITPQGTINVHGGTGVLEFKWEVDASMLGGAPYKSYFYLSGLGAGNGLWPEDPQRERTWPSTTSSWAGADSNPNRIYTTAPGLGWAPGRAYKIDEFGTITDDGVAPTNQTILRFTEAWRKYLTAGQVYYWGVKLDGGGGGAREATAFKAEAVSTGTPYNGVTILTHGFQLNPLDFFGNPSFQQPAAFLELARLISDAGGGGVVLSYDKNTGQWKDRTTGALGAAALKAGKPVVLVSDWNKESDISDAGFSEAAADAIFAALVKLNQDTSGKIFQSPLHFVGHSRGTVVNSEIIQRLGTYFPAVTNIHMTTLDPHDMEQKSLNVPLGGALTTVSNALYALAVAATATGNVAAAATLGAWANRLSSIVSTAEKLGIAISPIPYGDFKDPDVKVWSNIAFADNYYQTAALMNTGMTFTPNGRELQGADLNRLLNFVAGFRQDDIDTLHFGVGGPHSRVTTWYAGTVALDALEFNGEPIYRRVTDQGIAVEVMGIPAPNQTYTDKAWYSSDPQIITGDAALRHVYLQSITSWANDVWEGVANGWYFTAAGGGVAYRPASTVDREPVTNDNTEVVKHTGDPAVPSVFNGNFENGVLQSILHHKAILDGLLPGDAGRFPLSYELPGWSFHGGQGFSVGGFSIPSIGFSMDPIDVAGLFVVETNIGTLVKQLLVKAWEYAADKVIDRMKAAVSGKPKDPGDVTDADFQPGGSLHGKFTDKAAYQTWHDDNWADGTPNAERATAVDGLFDLLDSVYETSLKSVLGDLPLGGGATATTLRQWLEIGGSTPTSIDALKGYISKAIEDILFAKFFPGAQSDHALIMGAGAVLKDFVNGVVPDSLEDVVDDVINALVNFDSIRHNRMYIPADAEILSFDIFAPYIATAGTGVHITLEVDGTAVIDQDVIFGSMFFERRTFSVPVPAAARGKMATLTLKHIAMADTGLIASLINPFPVLPLPDDPAATISQLYLLDNIRFAGQIRQVKLETTSGLPYTAIKEGDTIQLRLQIRPMDDANPGQVKVDWGDGSAPTMIDLLSGLRTYTPSHVLEDSGDFQLAVEITGAHAEKTTTSYTVKNQNPVISGGTLSHASALAGTSEVELSGATFTDPGTKDTFTVTVDWGDGTAAETLTPVKQPDGSYTIPAARHVYADDAKTPADRDTYKVKLTVRDDEYNAATTLASLFDTRGEAVQEYTLVLLNASPTITTPGLPVTTVSVGQALNLLSVFGFSDPEWGNSETWTYRINWGDGSAPSNGSPVITQPGSQGVETQGTFGGIHTYGLPGLRTITIIVTDDDGGTGTASFTLNVNAPLSAAGGPMPGVVLPLTDSVLDSLLGSALLRWEAAGLTANDRLRLRAIQAEVVDLPGGQLGAFDGVSLKIDQDAAGYGWFIDPTPLEDAEFAPGSPGDTPARSHVDLLTVLIHELGHVLGLRDVSATARPVGVMSAALVIGQRRLPTAAADCQPVNAGDVVLTLDAGLATELNQTVSLINGGFSIADPANPAFGWQILGNVGIVAGQAEFREDPQLLTRLAQTFTMPAGVTALRFTILSSELGVGTSFPATFEVALLDTATQLSLVGTAAGLSETDALLNLQADGRVYYSDAVSAPGLPLSGETLALTEPLTFAVDLSQVAAGTEVRLYFDLLGADTRDSLVQVDHVFLVGATTEPPVASPDIANTSIDTPVVIPVLANDADPDGAIDPTTVAVTVEPEHGSLAIDPVTGAITYTPAAGFSGSDTFQYTVRDDQGNPSNAAVVEVAVHAVNHPPVAVDDLYETDEDVALIVGAPDGVLANDHDDDGDNLSARLVTDVAHGTLVLHDNGSFQYEPEANFHGVDSFTYVAHDGAADSLTVTVTITVNAVNDPPVAVVVAPGAGWVDVPLQFSAASSYDVDGSVVLHEWDWNGDGIFETSGPAAVVLHTWTAEYTGLVTLRVTDNGGLTDEATAEVRIQAAPDEGIAVHAGEDVTIAEGDVFAGAGTFVEHRDRHRGQRYRRFRERQSHGDGQQRGAHHGTHWSVRGR
ncbi:MAG: tandem-95 repeat protein [Planctomycetes bacterium]|nr:tandem-95 repeat protein [Planctomycetota bacterium]